MSRSGDDGERKARPRGGRRLAGAGLSLAAHAAVLAALIWAAPQVRKAAPPPPIETAMAFLDAPPSPQPSPAPPARAPAAAKAAAAPVVRSAAHRAVHAATAPARAAPKDDEDDGGAPGPAVELTGAALAGAASADSGGGGGPCDMARRVQAALRRDGLVREAVATAQLAPGPSSGRALLVWNGDWIRSGGEDGKGLAAVREAILWAVGFAPADCRAEPVRGFILFSVADTPGAPRLALGAPAWRWSDLLGPRPAR